MASAFTGKISGFGGNPNQSVDLLSVNSGPTVSLGYTSNANHSGGVLTVTSGGHKVAALNFIGQYQTANFISGSDSADHLLLVDPRAPDGIPGASVALFGNYLAASFAGGGGIALISAASHAADQPLLPNPLHAGG